MGKNPACVSVNAVHMLLVACTVTISHWNKFVSVEYMAVYSQ